MPLITGLYVRELYATNYWFVLGLQRYIFLATDTYLGTSATIGGFHCHAIKK